MVPYSSLSEYIKKDSVENSTAFIMKKFKEKSYSLGVT